ncbi:MAG: ROK family protein [Lentisphaeria bacterium]|nr:ROK family protein [Lentisphaeria bacterium]
MSEKIYPGFDIGGTKIGIGLISESGKFIAGERIDNVNTKPEDILPRLVTIVKKMIAENNISTDDIPAFGVSTPGPADIPNGIITAPPNNPYWRNVPLLKYLEDNLEIKGYFENDANAAAIAEGYFGAGKGTKDYIYLTMSTGIGAGIVTNGTLVQGTGFYGGEFGHTILHRNGRQCNCGLKGCYEAYCGGRAVADDLRRKLADKTESRIMQIAGSAENIDMKALAQAVRENDPFALEYWDEMIQNNAQAMGSLINIMNPAKLILGTFVWATGDLFLAPLKKYIVNYAWKEMLDQCDIVPSQLRQDIGYYAGSAVALYNTEKNA